MPLILGTNSIKDTGFDVANSLRLNESDDPRLGKSFSGAGNRRTFTQSVWIKRSKIGLASNFGMYKNEGSGGGNNYLFVGYFDSNDRLYLARNQSATEVEVITTRKFRDVSAWYNIVIAVDTTQGTASNRVKCWVNGVQETSFDSSIYPSQNQQFDFNVAQQHYIGANYNGTSANYDGYMAEFVFVDGTALDHTSFGEFDSNSPNIWKPIDVADQSITFGTNGFYLDFEDSSALGNDISGQNNDWTPTNLTSTDQSTDTCTNNFAVLQPNLGPRYSTQTFSNGNLSVSGGSGFEFHPSTIGMTTGKYYFEAKITTLTNYPSVGIIASHQFETNNQDAQSNTQGYVMHFNGQFNNNGVVDYTGTAMSQGDIIMIAFDSGNGVIWFGLNGTWQKSATQSEIEAGTTTNAIFTNIINAGSDSYHFLVQNYGSAWDANFGGTQTYTISSGNSDSNGYGNFEYAVPNGYYSLNTKNLAEFG